MPLATKLLRLISLVLLYDNRALANSIHGSIDSGFYHYTSIIVALCCRPLIGVGVSRWMSSVAIRMMTNALQNTEVFKVSILRLARTGEGTEEGKNSN